MADLIETQSVVVVTREGSPCARVEAMFRLPRLAPGR